MKQPQSLLDTAKTCCLQILKRADEESWADGEAVIQLGLIPFGDAILGLGWFLDALPEGDAVAFQESTDFGKFESLCKKTAIDFLEQCRTEASNGKRKRRRGYTFDGTPYLTAGHLQSGTEAPNIVAAVAYALLCARFVKDRKKLWGVTNEKEWDNLADAATERLLNTQASGNRGWGWRADVSAREQAADGKRSSGFEAELFPTMLACQALQSFEGKSPELQRSIDAAIHNATYWILRSLQANVEVGDGAAWKEFGTTGRMRLLDQVMALSILFRHASPFEMVPYGHHILTSLSTLLRRCLQGMPTEPDYHLFRHKGLIGMVPWEDVSLLYWTIGLLVDLSEWATQTSHQEKEVFADADRDSLEASGHLIKNVGQLLRSPLAQAARRALLAQLEEEGKRGDRLALWPKQGYRVYASWAAITCLARASRHPELFQQTKGRNDELFVALYKQITSPLFAGEFANQVVRSIELNFDESESDGATAFSAPSHTAVADQDIDRETIGSRL